MFAITVTHSALQLQLILLFHTGHSPTVMCNNLWEVDFVKFL